MKRNRYQHQANFLCEMFCGWQLDPDYRRLTELGSGELVFDLLHAACYHNGVSITMLNIGRVLISALAADLDRNGGSINDLSHSSLAVRYVLEEHEGQRDKWTSWAYPARVFVGCQLNLRSRIVTDTREFSRDYSAAIEWPKNWAP
jgi:hypothetical protein